MTHLTAVSVESRDVVNMPFYHYPHDKHKAGIRLTYCTKTVNLLFEGIASSSIEKVYDTKEIASGVYVVLASTNAPTTCQYIVHFMKTN